MKIDFPKLTREIDLAEYHPDIQEKMCVWVNPSKKELDALSNAFDKYKDSEGEEKDDLLLQVSSLLSQGAKDTHFSVDELQEMVSKTSETDPAFWGWVLGKVFSAISEHRARVKKN